MYVLGIDIGSTACKGVILTEKAEIISKSVVAFGTGTIGPAKVYAETLKTAGLEKSDIDRVLVTGYGRFTFDDADSQKSEISCHAKGIKYLLLGAQTIIDIGGQDVKVIRLNSKGNVSNFVMNDKCAAGTGRFLDVMAKVLNVETSQLGDLAEKAEKEISISSTCTVFAESEVISQLSTNVRIEDLVAGIHKSVARRTAGLIHRVGVKEDVVMSGGVSLNKGIVKAIGEEIDAKVHVHEDGQFAGAIGAALFALEEIEKLTPKCV